MTDEPKAPILGLIVAKLVCCGALVLVATGGLAGLGGWLSGVGLPGILAAGLVAIVSIVLWRSRIGKHLGRIAHRDHDAISRGDP